MKNQIFMVFMLPFVLGFGCMTGEKGSPIIVIDYEEESTYSQYDDLKPVHIPSSSANAYYYYMTSVLKQKDGDSETAMDLLHKAVAEDPQSSYLKMELLNYYLYEQDVEQALNIIEEILALDPYNTEALMILGQLYYEQENYAEVAAAYQRVQELDPDDKRVYLMLGEVYVLMEDRDAAERIYTELLKRFPDFYTGHFFIARLYFHQENYPAAERHYKQALALNPELEEPQYELLKIYKITGEQEKSIEIYQTMLAKNPNDIRAKISLGLYYRTTDPSKATELLKELGRESQHNQEIFRIIVQDYFNNKEYADVVIVLTGMLQGAPQSQDINYFLGVTYGELMESAAAIKHLQLVTRESDFYRNSVVHLVYWLQEIGRLEEAADVLEEVIRDLPDQPEFLGYLGAVYEELQQYEQAVRILQEGIKQHEDSANLYFRLGVVQDKMKNKEACIEAMKMVIELDPQNANALNYLGYTYAEMGINLNEAEQLIKRAMIIKPDDGYITDSLGWVYYQQGDYEQAREYLEKAVQLVPEEPVILEHLGDAYFKLKNYDKALKYYRKSLTHQDRNKDFDKAKVKQKIKDIEKDTP